MLVNFSEDILYNNAMSNTTDIIFVPVAINRGRKFRGDCYSIGSDVQFCSGNWAYSSWSVKLWDPKGMRYVYANPDYIEERACTRVQVEADLEAYIKSVITSTIAWCASKQPIESEAKKFARNCLLKNHPEMRQFIDEALPDQRDVVAEVERTLRWAINLRTRPCVMYGHVCKGGKAYGKTDTVRKAYHALDKKGVTKLEGFKEAWVFMTKSFDLPDYGVKLEENS